MFTFPRGHGNSTCVCYRLVQDQCMIDTGQIWPRYTTNDQSQQFSFKEQLIRDWHLVSRLWSFVKALNGSHTSQNIGGSA